MKLGRLSRRLGVAVTVALASVPFASSSASAASAPPASYTVVVRAYPLSWAGSGALPVVDVKVPYVRGVTNNVPVAEARAALAQLDHNVTAMSGEEVRNLTCTGFDERRCRDPFIPEALLLHNSSEPRRSARVASFDGKDGKFPGHIRAALDCPDRCGSQLVRTVGEAAGPAGGFDGHISISGSSAGHDVTVDDRGRLVGVARSELRNVVIGPRGEVRASSIVTTAHASGSGAANSKDGRSEVRVSDFVILDNQVELTRAGLRLAGGAPSEQEAYDGARALLDKLKERGITLELPDFSTHVERHPDHVAVKAGGLRVSFDGAVPGPPGVPTQPVSRVFELGSSTALVAAFDDKRRIDVSIDGEQVAVEQPDGAGVPVAETPPQEPAGGADSRPPRSTSPPRGGNGHSRPGGGGDIKVSAPPAATPPGPAPETRPVEGPEVPEVAPSPSDVLGDDLNALPGGGVVDTLGLRGAQSVSRAFGAFLGLGLILPLARFVIRRFG